MLKTITINSITPNDNPRFLKTQAVNYTREGSQPAIWEVSLFPDTVHVLVHNTTTDSILLVEQVRVPALVRSNHQSVIECAAGIIDKYPELSHQPQQRASLIAIEEVHEELGYSIDTERILPLPTYISGAGSSGGTCYPFFCTVTDDDFVGQQLEPSEDIEVFTLPLSDIPEFLSTTTNTDATTRSLLQWFLLNAV